jgi:hypothetical protein
MLHATDPASLCADKGKPIDVTELAPVLVLWADSVLQEGWGSYIENVLLEFGECVTVGHLFRETDEVVVVALSRTRASYGSFMTIPRSAVRSIIHLVPAEPQQQKRCVRKRRTLRN